MARPPLVSWHGREYDHNPKSADWYWALGIIAMASALAAILFANYLFAIVILFAAVAIALHSTKHPPLHTFSLTERGLRIGEELHLFDTMISFSILEHIEGELPPLLSIYTESWLSPHLEIPLEGVDVDMVHAIMLERVPEAEHEPTLSDMLGALLGF